MSAEGKKINDLQAKLKTATNQKDSTNSYRSVDKSG